MICFFCFYNHSGGIQSRLAFSDTFKHCNIITFDGELYLAHEFDLTGVHVRNIHAKSCLSLSRGLKHINALTALIVVMVHKRVEISWKPYIVRSCNEYNRYVSGINIGFTFNPQHLYTKLLCNDDNDYELLHHWRR